MRLKQLKRIIKEEVKKIQLQEQVLPGNPGGSGGSCALTPAPQGPKPNNFEESVWVDKFGMLFNNRLDNQGQQQACTFYLTKKDGWENTLSNLHAKPHPKCNPKWQNMLHFKLKEANIIAMNGGC